ncbi:MAG: DNA-3-methyladenine glycosylase [Coriobacteriia bacterium]|nr:DNA-3-methyladenine glycosylase [Coriobacteriia bacterium]
MTGGFEPDAARILPPAFFARPTVTVARELLGKVLASRAGGALTAGVIVETEAYLGSDDPGSHAATRGVTARNRVMYGPPGCAYVYFTYGNHHMLNLVTEGEGVAGAVLVRAIEPVAGLGVMEARRPGRADSELTNGPGRLASALGIDLGHNGVTLGGEIAVYDAVGVDDERVGASGRIGLSAGHDLPLRFYLSDNRYVSRERTGPRSPKRAVGGQTRGTA